MPGISGGRGSQVMPPARGRRGSAVCGARGRPHSVPTCRSPPDPYRSRPSGVLGYDSTEYPRIRKPGRRTRMLFCIRSIRGRAARAGGAGRQGRGLDSHAGYAHAPQSRAEQSRAEQSRAEQSRAEQSRAEQSRAEQSRAEHWLTAPFLRPAAAGRLKLNTTLVMDDRRT